MKLAIATIFALASSIILHAQCPQIESEIESDIYGNYWCNNIGGTANLTVEADLPSGASNVSYLNVFWNSNPGGQTYQITGSGVYTVTGQVKYDITSGGSTTTYTCNFDPSSIEIYDKIFSYVESNLADHYYCGVPTDLKIISDLPEDAINIVYTNCYWNSMPGGSSTTITAPGLYSFTGEVSYTIGTQSFGPCVVNAASIEIFDGQNPSNTNYVPNHYWPFDVTSINIGTTTYTNANLTVDDYRTDLMGPGLIDGDPYSGGGGFNVETNGQVNDYVHLEGGTSPSSGKLGHNMNFSNKEHITCEFLIKFDSEFMSSKHWNNQPEFFKMGSFGPKKFNFTLTFNRGGITEHKEELSVNLNGIDRKDWNYYADGEWHHFVLTADLNEGRLKLYVDGFCPEGFEHQYFPYPGFDNVSVNGSHRFGAYGSQGLIQFADFDEYVLSFEEDFPATLCYQHWQNASSGQHYDFADGVTYCSAVAPNAPNTVGTLNPLDYPTGYVMGGGGASGASNIDDPLEQIINSPSPRYLPHNTLRRNFPGYAYNYLARSNFISNWGPDAALLNEELASNWNYLTYIGRNTSDWDDLKVFTNGHPEIPSYFWTNWNVNRLAYIGLPGGTPYQRRTDLATYNYHKLSDGNQTTTWSPEAPLQAAEIDGMAHAQYIDACLDKVMRPIDIVGENGEMKPIKGWKEPDVNHAYNPDVQTAYSNYQGPPTYGDWDGYRALAKTRFRSTYRDEMILNNPYLSNNGTAFTYYTMDGKGGHYANGWDWGELREIEYGLDDEHYATADYYPHGPDDWATDKGSRHGIKGWMTKARHIEIDSTDTLCSPFVAAGWNDDPTKNIRPGQWLGLLKCLGVMGTEFYYGSFFSLGPSSGGPPTSDARHWAWQTIMPGYAQAITSRYEEILRKGELLEDPDHIVYATNPSIHHYGLRGGGASVMSVSRKWINSGNPSDIRYIISSTLQPYSNYCDQYEKDVTIEDFDGATSSWIGDLSFNTRRQGSTYLLRKDEQTLSELVFIQLDGWHEAWHPTHWDQDFVIEAENYDELIQVTTNVSDEEYIQTRTRVPSSSPPYEMSVQVGDLADFTDFTSFVTFPNSPTNSANLEDWGIIPSASSPKLSYHFRTQNNGGQAGQYTIYIRARNKDVSLSATGININLKEKVSEDQVFAEYAGCITNTNWKWYSYGLCGELNVSLEKQTDYILELTPENELVEIDQIILDFGQDINSLSELHGPCGSPDPNPTNSDLKVEFSLESECSGDAQAHTTTWPRNEAVCQNTLTYEWTIGTQTFGPASGNTSFPNGGTYKDPIIALSGSTFIQVEVDDGSSTAIYSTTVSAQSPPVINSTTASPTSVCEGSETTLTVSVSGGTGQIQYSWFPSVSTWSSYSASTVAKPVKPSDESYPYTHKYEVEVVDENGCTDVDIVNVTVTEPLNVSFAGTDNYMMVCEGYSSTVDLDTAIVTGGSGPPYNYAWTPSSTLTSANTSQPTVQPQNGEILLNYYTVEVDDGQGCKGSAGFLIDVKSNIDAEIKEDEAPCAGVSNGEYSAKPWGGASNFTYAWSYSLGSSCLTDTSGSTTEVLHTSACENGTLTLTVSGMNCNSTANYGVQHLVCKVGSVSHQEKEEESEDTPAGVPITASIFPNPTSGEFTITFTEKVSGPLAVFIRDVSGKLLDRIDASDTQYIDYRFSNISSGMYFVQVRGENILSNHTLILD